MFETKKNKVYRKFGLDQSKTYSLPELAKITDTPLSVLKKVEDRGYGAYKSNPMSVRMKGSFKKGVNAPMSKKLSAPQWAKARVFSFLAGNPKHDQDLKSHQQP